MAVRRRKREAIVARKANRPSEEIAAGWWIECKESVTWKRGVMDRVARPAIHKQLVIAVSTRTRNRLLYIDTRRKEIDWRNVNKRLIKWEERWYALVADPRETISQIEFYVTWGRTRPTAKKIDLFRWYPLKIISKISLC